MSINGSLSGITFSGLSSGIDSDSIISRLMQLEAIPLQRLQQRQQQANAMRGVYSQFRGYLQSLSTAGGALNNPSVFNPMSAASSDTSVASVTTTSSATAGTYNLSVTKLAQAQKIATAAQTDTTTPLNKTGSFVVNGKAVAVEASDSLKTLAQKINSANAGVTASLIDGGSGSAYLTVSSNTTGANNKVQFSDLVGDTLSSLGLATGTTSIREPITNGATSGSFSSPTTAVGEMLGATGLSAGTINVNGIAVGIDLVTDGLQAIADKINAAATGATATVRTIQKDGATLYKLDIAGASTPTLEDVSGNILGALGVLQRSVGNELVNAQDAEFKIDTISLTSSSNTVTTAVPGATITLLKANATTPEKSTLTLTRDDKAIKDKIKAFMDAYNEVITFVRDNSQFDKESFGSGPLFGDPTAQQLEQSVNSLVFADVPGLTGAYKNLTSLGFNVDEVGKLTLDESVLTTALQANPSAVSDLFRTVGKGSINAIEYVSSTSKTVASGTGSYDVEITALATKGAYTAELAQTTASTVSETLTFSGNLFGGTPYQLSLNVGSTLADTVNRINSDSKLKDLVVATIDNGSLKIESKKFGANGNFTVVSNYEAAADNSGIGVGSLGAKVTGVDIQGTINGEAATGSGQFLTGNADNATTSGLQILYTGTSTGIVGNIKVTKGMGSQVVDLMGTFTDSVNGLLTSVDKSIQSQLDDIAKSITDLQTRLATKQQDLQIRFSRMEEAISRIQAQSSRLTSLNTTPK